MSDKTNVQKRPQEFHDATNHGFDPDENGVCKTCGWWDPNGNICPYCGQTWEEHYENPCEVFKCGVVIEIIEVEVQIPSDIVLFGNN